MTSPMRALFLCGLPRSGPSSRPRVYEHADRLRARGFEIDVRPFLSERAWSRFYDRSPLATVRKAVGSALGLLRRRSHLATATKRYDVVLVHRELVPRGNRRAVARLGGVPWVYDFDDSIWLAPRDYVAEGDASQRRMVRFKDPAEVDDLIRAATLVLAGNETLAQHARPLARAAEAVEVVPTAVDVERLRPREKPPRGARPVVGWIGSPTATYCLREILPALEAVAARRPLRLVAVGAGEDLRSGSGALEIESRPWSLAREADDLAGFDIGLYPLPDNEWTRGKCGYKALQYFAAGVPAVVAPVGVNAMLAGDGARALAATTAAEWTEAVARLLDDEVLARGLATRARAYVVERFSYEAITPLVERALRRAAEGAR